MRILVTGASGLLGQYLLAERPSEVTVVAWSGRTDVPVDGIPLTPVPLEDARRLEAAYRMTRPAAILHLAACANLSECLRDPQRARRINTEATGLLARLARHDGIRMISVSTDLVFDGTAPPYAKDAPPTPLSVYGRTKADGERAALDQAATVLRLPLLYGPGRGGRAGFFDQMVRAIQTQEPLTLFHDEYRTPLDMPTAASILWQLVAIPTEGILHAPGPERLSRVEMGLRLAACLGRHSAPIRAVSRRSLAGPEPRPEDTSLHGTLLLRLLPDLVRPSYEQALARCLASDGPPVRQSSSLVSGK